MANEVKTDTFFYRATGLTDAELNQVLSDVNGCPPIVAMPIAALPDYMSMTVVCSIQKLPPKKDAVALGLSEDEIKQVTREHRELNKRRLQLATKLKNLNSDQAALTFGYLEGALNGRRF